MPNAEKRRSQRKQVQLHASVAHLDSFGESKPTPVRTLNLSKTGALIEAADRMYAGEVCSFNMVTRDAKNVVLQGRIIWVKQQTNGAYQAGVAFRNLSADEEYMISLVLVRS